MTLQSVRIDGEPPTFNYPMSEREKDWRARVAAAVGRLQIGPADGIRAQFTTSSDKRGGHYFDLDNMAKCVFDAFGRHRLKCVEVTRQVGPKPGVVLTVGLPEPPTPLFLCCMAVRRGSKRDPVRDPALSYIVANEFGTGPLSVHLAFHEDVSFTDFGLSGAIKPALDCLWPLLGGTSANPHDHRIKRLVLTRSSAHPSGVCVYIGVGGVEVVKIEVSYTVEAKDGVTVFLAWMLKPNSLIGGQQAWLCIGSCISYADARDKLIEQYKVLRALPEPPPPHTVEVNV